MQIRWTPAAVNDLETIADYLCDNAPERAAELVRQIYESPDRLTRFPRVGRAGRRHGTRELIVNSLPYVIVYRLTDEAIHILRVLHGAQKWP